MAYPIGHIETFVLNVGSTPINVVTGTVAAPTTPAEMFQHKGATITFQCQHSTAKVKVGGADVKTLGGIALPTGGVGVPYQVTPSTGGVACINAAEWWVLSDQAGDTTVVVQLIHSI